MSNLAWITLFGFTLLAACSPAGPVRHFTKGDELFFNEFSEPNTFEQGGYEGARLQITDGVYRISITEGDSTFWWGQWGEIYDNVVIDVDMNQLSERNENMYGVMCRVRGTVGLTGTPDAELEAIMSVVPAASESLSQIGEATEEAGVEATEDATEAATPTEDSTTSEATDEPTEEAVDAATEETTAETDATPESTEVVEETPEATETTQAGEATLEVANGDSYLFLIRGDQSYAIMRARGRDVAPLVGWGTSSAITPGPGKNHIRAVCVNDYLALYVNDQFVADAIDDTYERGQVGLVAAAVDRLGVQVEFDNLSISRANPE